MGKYELQRKIRAAQRDVESLNRIIDKFPQLKDVPPLVMRTRLHAQDVLNELLEKQEVEPSKP